MAGESNRPIPGILAAPFLSTTDSSYLPHYSALFQTFGQLTLSLVRGKILKNKGKKTFWGLTLKRGSRNMSP
jgi:hypothetical protein